MNIYYIYQHRRNDTKEIFYVGKGKTSRCLGKTGRNPLWKEITKKTDYTIEILFENLSEEIAFLVEIGLIAKYKNQGIDLCNCSIGGNGPLGYKHTEKAKIIMSRKRKGYKLSSEHKRKISESNKNKTISTSQRIKISNSLKGRSLSQEHKDNIRKSMLSKSK